MEEYKEKYEKLESELEDIKRECESLHQKEKLLLNETKSKDITIADLREVVNSMQVEIYAKNKEIALLKEKYEEGDLNLAVSFDILALDQDLDAQELARLREDNKQLRMELAQAAVKAKEHQELASKIEDLNKKMEEREKEYEREIREIGERHEKELDDKDAAIKKLEGANSVLESKAFQLMAVEKLLKQKIDNSNAVAAQNQKELLESESTKNEMRSEIKVLILQCKEQERGVAQRDEYIKKQQEGMTELNYELERARADASTLQQQNSRLATLLKEKKEQLSSANMKVRELKTSIAADYKSKLEEQAKAIEVLKEIIRGHNAELSVKNKDIQRLKKNLGKAKSLKQRIRQPEIEEPDVNVVEQKVSMDVSKDVIDEVYEAESPVALKEITYKEKYMQRIEEYFNKLHDLNYRNNSSNIRNVLYHPFAKKEAEIDSRSKSLLTRNEQTAIQSNNNLKISSVNQSEEYSREFDVNEIIRKSINRGNVRSNVRNAKAKFRPAQQVDINGSPVRNRKLMPTNKRLIFT